MALFFDFHPLVTYRVACVLDTWGLFKCRGVLIKKCIQYITMSFFNEGLKHFAGFRWSPSLTKQALAKNVQNPSKTIRIDHLNSLTSLGDQLTISDWFWQTSFHKIYSLLFLTEPTKITVPPLSMDATVGESIVLPCEVSKDSTLHPSFKWFFNGKLIDFSRHDHFGMIGGVRFCFFIY